jgi:hypothetical protein
MAAVSADVVLAAERGDADVYCRHLAFRVALGLGVACRPTGIAMLLAQPGRLGLPILATASARVDGDSHRLAGKV